MSTFGKLTKDMETGVEKVDNQHKELIVKMNELVALASQAFSKEKAEEMLEFLGGYVVQHFADEEELQIECNYPKYELHKKQHQDFVELFLKKQKEFHEEGNSAKFMMDLILVASNWVIKHIKGHDVEFGRYYKKTMINKQTQ